MDCDNIKSTQANSSDDEGGENVFTVDMHWRTKSVCSPLNYITNRTKHESEIKSSGGESLMDGLLWDLYDRWNGPQRNGSVDSDTFTEGSSLSEAWQGRAYHNPNEHNSAERLTRANLQNKGGYQELWLTDKAAKPSIRSMLVKV